MGKKCSRETEKNAAASKKPGIRTNDSPDFFRSATYEGGNARSRELHTNYNTYDENSSANTLYEPRSTGASSLHGHADWSSMGHDNPKSTCLPTSRDEPDGTNVHAAQARGSELLSLFSIWNCRGLKPRTVPSKVPYIQDLLRDQNYLFMALTETWLGEHLDAEIEIEGFSIFRQDRHRQRSRRGRNSGGVAVYIRNDIASEMEIILDYSSGVIEIIGLYSKAKNLLLLVVYRQPDDIAGGHRSTSKEFKPALCKLGEVLSTYSQMPDILLCGDFNLPHVSWDEGQAGERANREEKVMTEDLLELTNEYFLSQIIQKPTHKSGNTFDLLFTNNQSIVHSYNTMETLLSDHDIIECRTTYCIMSSDGEKPECMEDSDIGFDNLNFFSEDTDWISIENELYQHNWELEFRSCSSEQMLEKFIEICKDICIEYVPLRKKKSTLQNKSLIPRDRRKLMRKRRRIIAQLKKTTSETRRKKLKGESVQIESELIKSYQQSQKVCETKAVDAIKRNSKYFFSYAKKFSTSKTGVGPFIDENEDIVTNCTEMADMLSEQYSSVYSTPKEPLPMANELFSDTHVRENCLNNIIFDEEDIMEAIEQISASAAAGPDKFPALFLKTCKCSVARPLFLIWRRSLDSGIIPLALKTANIVPIHKGGSRGTPSNYRPVALTSHLLKLFERVLRKNIVAYMEENNLFNPGQHGFRQGRSCLSQLIAHFDNISRLLEDGKNVDVVYLDFAKAFDKLDFLATMRKLHQMGISGKLGRWIYSFLTDRKQAVLVNGITGSFSGVKSGVPQGSVIGPLLFLILISDIDQGVTSSFVSSFADDTRVVKDVTTVDDVEALQADLQAIYNWADENNMDFNNPKFECLRYGKTSEIKEHTCYKASAGDTIKVADHVRDLGVIMSSSGTFRQHVNNVIATSNQLCGWVLRTFQTRQTLPMLTLWKSLIRSKLEYCCQLWSPTNPGDIQGLEQVQRSFIRKISGIQELTYWQQLQKLSMYSLERRRERYIIIYIWKIMEQHTPNFSNTDLTGIKSVWHPRRGRNCIIPAVNFRGPKYVQTMRYASFGLRGPRLFNILPAYIRNISGCSVDSFKRRLDRYLATVPDEPQIRGYTSMRRADSNSLLHMAQFAVSQIDQIGRDSHQDCNQRRPSMVT